MSETHWKPDSVLMDALIGQIPRLLASQREDGRFGDEPWTCRDQEAIYPIAAAWAMEGSRFYHTPDLLAAVVRGGDALIREMDGEGRWVFRRKDGSEGGMVRMPWTYSRWIKAYSLIREAIADDTRARWDEALTRGFDNIAGQDIGAVQKSAHHAMALAIAGRVLDRTDWCDQASASLARVVSSQSEDGWWSENYGPIVDYGFIYSDALGTYFAVTKDESVLPALERAAKFHAMWTYPDGSAVETIDERNRWRPGVHLGNPGFTWSAVGRRWLARQHEIFLASGGTFDADYAASLLLYGGSGEIEPPQTDGQNARLTMGDKACAIRRGTVVRGALGVRMPGARVPMDSGSPEPRLGLQRSHRAHRRRRKYETTAPLEHVQRRRYDLVPSRARRRKPEIRAARALLPRP